MAERQPVPRLGRRVWLASLLIVVFLFLFFLGSMELANYTESTPFCTSCHTMDPEKVVYQTSPHQKVDCGTCHIGPGAVPAVQAKIAAVRYLYTYPLNLYERPIPSPVKSMRPVEVVCEQCHWPQKFYSDRLVQIDRFAEDESNTQSVIYLLLRTSGGSQREGLGKGIHWHIEAHVRYRAADSRLQDVPWVQVEENGVTKEYIASNTQLPQAEIEALPVREMDCLDCHNRATHVFQTPADAIDQAMATGQLDSNLPYLKREGVKLLEPFYASQDAAADIIARDLTAFYTSQYPATDPKAVEVAAKGLGALYRQIKFPDMKTDWTSHPNNIGHKDYPGCFRCHDGQHFDAQKESIRLECNICHNIPQASKQGEPVPLISPAKTIPEPDSHKDTNWIALHRKQFDATCSVCHDTANAGGSDNTSFCSNRICHGTVWKFAGLDAPGILQLESPTEKIAGQAAKVPHPVAGREDCLACHGAGGIRPFPADHAGRPNNICVGCHEAPPTPAPAPVTAPTATQQAPVTEAAPAAGAQPPAIPHSLEGRGDCLMCHGLEGPKPFPADHKGRSKDMCTVCHQPQPQMSPTPAATVTVAPTQAAGVPGIPHALEGREDCLVCHGAGGVKPYPADHAGRTKEMCTGCHQMQAVTPVATTAVTVVPTQASPSPTAATVAPTQAVASPTPTAAATVAPTQAAVAAPGIPHTLEGREDCLVCHGAGGVKPYPADHKGRSVGSCIACHKQGEGTGDAEADED
jgi:nitrate/TMAO reductase-like tetraheme cytochrome c subunit